MDELEEQPEPTKELTLFDDNYEAKLNTWNFRRLLSRKYTIVCTNPPYLNKYNAKLKDFVNSNYKDYSGDLFSVFIYRNLLFCQTDGYCGFMTPFVWMFIKTYEKLRQFIIQNKSITTLIQMEYSAFEEATVPICAFVLKNGKETANGLYFKLSEFKGGMEVQREKVLEALKDKNCGYFYEASAVNFSKIPGSPIAYWVNTAFYSAYQNGRLLGSVAYPKKGLATTDNNRFLRLWHEVNFDKVGIGCTSALESEESAKKWFPLNKGGAFRRWYGNNEYLVNWENNGQEMKNAIIQRYNGGSYTKEIRSEDRYFLDSITWSALTAGMSSFRYSNKGALFDSAGSSMFPFKMWKYLLAFLNTKVTNEILSMINPTLNYGAGSIANLPIIVKSDIKPFIEKITVECVNISTKDWDSYETSWDFKRHPLV